MTPALSPKRARLDGIAARSAQPTGRPRLPIRDVVVRRVREPAGKREYLLVRIDTDGGPSGYGEAAASPDVAGALARPALLGWDALASQLVDAQLVRTGAHSGARVAVNMALLDILGKVAKAPACDVLAGRTRHKARAMAPLHGHDRTTLIQSLERARDRGFRAFVVAVQIPDGPVRSRDFYRSTLDLLTSLRAAGGEDAGDFVLDCGGRTTAAEASVLAATLEGFHPMWIDEPCGPAGDEALVKISRESVTPLGWGRRVAGNDGFQNLLRLQAIDVLRPDLAAHPVAGIRKAAALAEAYYTAIAPYHVGGPLATAAALHIAASLPNFVIQQVPLPAEDRDLAMREELAGKGLEVPRDGFLDVPAGPGLGVEIDEDAIGRYTV